MTDAGGAADAAADARGAAEGATDETQERHRLAVIATSLPLLALTAPCFLTIDRDRSLLEETRWRAEPVLMLASIFVWPVLVGLLGGAAALRRRAPGRVAFGVPAVALALASALGLAGLTMALVGQSEARESLPIWVAALACVAACGALARGVRRAGWERWSTLGLSIAMASTAMVMALAGASRGLFDAPPPSMWVVMFALGAMAAPLIWAMVPRRA